MRRCVPRLRCPFFPCALHQDCLRTFGRAPLQLNFVRARLIGQLPNLDAAVPDIGKLARELQVCQRCVVWGVWGHRSAASQVGQPAGWTPQTVGYHMHVCFMRAARGMQCQPGCHASGKSLT